MEIVDVLGLFNAILYKMKKVMVKKLIFHFEVHVHWRRLGGSIN